MKRLLLHALLLALVALVFGESFGIFYAATAVYGPTPEFLLYGSSVIALVVFVVLAVAFWPMSETREETLS